MPELGVPFGSVAEVIDKHFQEAAIILSGPPIQIFAQRAAPTIALRGMQQHFGKFYYECKTLTGGYMQLGWADGQFNASSVDGKGVGDDVHSWAYDGYRCLKWHGNQSVSFGRKWEAGDVIGIAVDLSDQSKISFSLNGDWDVLGVAFEHFTFSGAVFPAITLLRGERVELYLGVVGNEFLHGPPSDDYSALTVTQRTDKEETRKFYGFTSVVEMGISEHSFSFSFPGEIMVNVMKRGLEYEAKKNAIIHGGYEATLKLWESRKEIVTRNTEGLNLSRDEMLAIICYTLETPPVYRYFNNDTRKGYIGDGMDFPILSHLLREGCRKLLGAMQIDSLAKTVYRGVGGIKFNAIVGQRIRFGSYTSTTMSKTVADEFMNGVSCATIFIAVTKLGAPIKMLSQYPNEDEVLVPPYEEFKVTAIVKSEPIKIYLESTVDDHAVALYIKNGTILQRK